jgi:PHD/YefM family antitoxin component YafN of YafNO toxin-antitoxin module
MTIQHIPLTQANRRMKQIRQFMNSDGLVVLTSHDKPTLIVLDVDRCWRLLRGAEQLVQLLLASNVIEAAQAVSAADASGLSSDRDWIKRTLEDLKSTEKARPKIRSLERSPRE